MSLARADELCEGGPRFTGEERERIKAYKPPGTIQITHWMKRRKGQSSKAAADERNEWMAHWAADLRRMERDFG